MMRPTTIATWQPIRIDIPSAPAASFGRTVRWTALAFASLAVPIAIAASSFSQPAATPALETVAPVTVEAPAAVGVESVATSSAAPAAADSAMPSYFYIDWAGECETECPALVATD